MPQNVKILAKEWQYLQVFMSQRGVVRGITYFLYEKKIFCFLRGVITPGGN